MIRSLIDQYKTDGIVINLCLFDWEFCSMGTISALKELGAPYLMPYRNNSGVVGTIHRFAAGDRLKGAIPCVLEGAGGTAPYTVVIAACHKREHGKFGSTAPQDRFIGFTTNMPWVDVIICAVRWGIEPAQRLVSYGVMGEGGKLV